MTAGLSACADYRVGQYRFWPSVVLSNERVRILVPPPETSAAVDVARHFFPVTANETVIGTLGTLVLRQGDTLSDVARHFGLGYEEIVAANPELDPWVIDHQTRALVPLQFVLPEAPQRGLVINLAAMRLYHYPASPDAARVVTYPVGIGREGRPLGLPARRERVGEGFRVVAGPFADAEAARKAATRLKIDLELDGRVLAPETERSGVNPPTASPTPGPHRPEPAGSEPRTLDADPGKPAYSDRRPPEMPIPAGTRFEEPAVLPRDAPSLEFPPDLAP